MENNELTSFEKLFESVNESIRNMYLILLIPVFLVIIALYVITFIFKGINPEIPITLLFVALGLFGLAKWQQKKIEDNKKLLNQVIRERYLDNYLAAIPKGDTPIQELMNLLEGIFPQIKIALRKRKTKVNKIGFHELDTKSGKFFIKEINEELTLELLKQTINDLSKARSHKLLFKSKPYRSIILAHDVEKTVNDELFEQMMEKIGKNVDLILYGKNGFELCWVS